MLLARTVSERPWRPLGVDPVVLADPGVGEGVDKDDARKIVSVVDPDPIVGVIEASEPHTHPICLVGELQHVPGLVSPVSLVVEGSEVGNDLADVS